MLPLSQRLFQQTHVCWDGHGALQTLFCQHLQPTLAMHQPVCAGMCVRVRASFHNDGNLPLFPLPQPCHNYNLTHHRLKQQTARNAPGFFPACCLLTAAEETSRISSLLLEEESPLNTANKEQTLSLCWFLLPNSQPKVKTLFRFQ